MTHNPQIGSDRAVSEARPNLDLNHSLQSGLLQRVGQGLQDIGGPFTVAAVRMGRKTVGLAGQDAKNGHFGTFSDRSLKKGRDAATLRLTAAVCKRFSAGPVILYP